MQSEKSPAYARWAKVYNLKQMAAAPQYLRDTEAALSKTARLMEATVDYAKTRPVFDGYKAARYRNTGQSSPK